LFCPYVDEVWREVKADFHIHLNRKAFISPRVWTLDFVDRCSDLEATVLMVSLWHIWDARNKYREGEGFMHPKSIAAKIKAYIDMICIHLYKPTTATRCEPSSSTPKWVSPPAGIVLVNVDAATFSSTRQMGIGVVVRDHQGTFVASCGEHRDEVTNAELAEALALRRVVAFACDEGYSRVIFASDCQSVINRVNAGMMDRSCYGPVIEDVKRLARSFVSCSFKHVYRVANVVAHVLARRCEFSVDAVWRVSPPECIREDICNDIMII
jgi:ribonuclease HI